MSTLALRRAARAMLARFFSGLGIVALLEDPSSAARFGDCNADGSVTVDELILGVKISLDPRALDACQLLDRNASRAVEIDELIAAVGSALNRDRPSPTATAPTETAVVASPTPTCVVTAIVTGTPKPSTACQATDGGFVDCFPTAGLDVGVYEGQNGAAVADVDGDGFPDVFLWNTSGAARLFRNLGHDMQFESFADTTVVSLGEITVDVAAFGDLDNDGRPDLVMSAVNSPIKLSGDQNAAGAETPAEERCLGVPSREAFFNRVYRNLGAGTFEDVTDAWGFSDNPFERGAGVVKRGLSLVDLNFDGRLDVVQFFFDPELRPLTFVSQPDGTTWKEAGRDVFGDARGLIWTMFFTDANDDQLPDVFVLNDYLEGRPNKYYERVDRSLTYAERELLPLFGTQSFGAPMGAATADLNGDGELDLVVTDTGDQRLLSLGVDVEDAWGIKQNPSRYGIPQNCWSVAVMDLENDGRPDLFFTCAGFRAGSEPDKAASFVLRNVGGRFEIAPGSLPNEEVPTWEFGLAVADFDQDGRLDLLTGGEAQPPRLLWNRIPAPPALALRLKGKRSNAQGIGARVAVEADDLPKQVREMYPGGSTWGYADTQLLFGIGQASRAMVTVDWRPAGGTAVQTVEMTPGTWVIEEP